MRTNLSLWNESEAHYIDHLLLYHSWLPVLLGVQGSTVEREAGERERAKVSPTLKDVDFINSGSALYVCESDRMKLMSILKSDTQVWKQRFSVVLDVILIISLSVIRIPVPAFASLSLQAFLLSNDPQAAGL